MLSRVTTDGSKAACRVILSGECVVCLRTGSTFSPVWVSVFGKRPLGRPRRRWKDNIKMDLIYVEGSQ